MQPGDQLFIDCEIKSDDGTLTKLEATGKVGDSVAVSGRLVLERFNLAEREGVDPAFDEHMKHKFRLAFKRLCNQVDSSNLAALAATQSG